MARQLGRFIGAQQVSANNTSFSGIINNLDTLARLKKDFSIPSSNPSIVDKFLIAEGTLEEQFNRSHFMANYGYGANDIIFSDDGTKVYFLDDTDVITQYRCNITGSVERLVCTGQFDLADSEHPNYFMGDAGYSETSPRSIAFGNNGYKFYLVGDVNPDYINEFDLTTPWDLNTATWVRKFDWGAYQSIQFNSDGTKVYTSYPNGSNIILQWSLSTAWDVSTLSLDSGVNLNSFYDGVVSDHQFKPDGTKLYVSHYDYTFIDEIDLTTPWDLSTATFNQRLSLVGTDGHMNYHKFALNPNGDKLIISTSSQVQQFDLETPWDISTTNLNYKKDRLVMETRARQNGYISRDGHHAYTVHITGDDTYKSTVFQYYMDNAWETQYMSLTGKYLDITDLQDDIDYISFIWFKDDGTKMWIGSYANDQIWAFDLSTAFDISTATYANETLYVGSQETGPRHMFIGDSGSKLYVIGTTGDDITEYSLSTAYDISTATYVTEKRSIASTATMGITFDNTGAYVYLVDYTSDLVYRWTLTTAWDISTLDVATVQTITARFQPGTTSYLDERTPYGLQLSSDGTRMVVIGDYRDNFASYTLSTAWDLSTASLDVVDATGTFATNTQNPYRYTTAIDANQDFTSFYVADDIKDSIFQYNLSSNSSLTTTSNVYHFSIASETTSPSGLQLKPDGTEMYVMQSGGPIYTYTLSTAWDIRTASVNASKQSADLNSSGFRIVNNGTQLIASDDSPDEIQSYTLSTAWDLSTATIDTNNQLTSLHNQNRRGPFMSNDGTKLYFHQFNDNWMVQYDLSTAWDLSSANTSYVKYYVPDEWHGTVGVGSIFNASGNTMYHLLSSSGQNWFSRGADSIVRRELNTPWELDTVQHPYYDIVDSGDYFWQYVKHPENEDQYFILSNDGDLRHIDHKNRYQIAVVNFKALGRVINAYGFNFKSDGTGLYIVDSSKCSIDYYTLSTAWDITTHDYQYSVTDILNQTFGTDAIYNLRFKPDGTQLYLLNGTEDKIYQFEMTTPWDIRTMVYNSQSVTTTGETTPHSFDIDSTGKYLIYGGRTDQVMMAILSTAWDISTADTANRTASGVLPGGDTHLCAWIDSNHFIKGSRYTFYKYRMKLPYDVSTITTTAGANSFNTYDFSISISQNGNYDTEFFQASTNEQYFVYGTGSNHAERMENTTAGDYSTLSYLTHGTAGKTGLYYHRWFANFGYTARYSDQFYYAKNLWTHENFDATLSKAFVIYQHATSLPDRTAPYGSWVFGEVNTTTNGIESTRLTQLRNITSGVNTGVSNIGGHSWKRDGTEVYFSTNDGKIYAMRTSTPWSITSMDGYTSYYWTPNSNNLRNLSFCDIKTEAYAIWDSGNTTIRAFDFSDDGTECIILFDNDSKNAHVYSMDTPWDITTLKDSGYRIGADNDLANSVCYRGNKVWLVDKDGKQFNHPVKKYEWEDSLAQLTKPMVVTQSANTNYQFLLNDGLDTFVITFAVDETTINLGESVELSFEEDESQPLANNGTVSINGLVATVEANTTNDGASTFAGTFYLTEQPMNRKFNAGTSTFQLGSTGKQYAGAYVERTGGTLVTHDVSSGANIDAQIDALSDGDALVLSAGTYSMGGGTDAFRGKNICIAGENDPNDVIIEHNHDTPSGVRDHPIFNIASTDLSQQMAFLRYKRIQTSGTNYISALVKGFGDVKGKMVNCILDLNNGDISWIYDNNNDPQVDVRFIRCTFYNYANWDGRYSGRTDVVKATDCIFDAGFNTGDVVETNYATNVTVNGTTGAYDTTTHSDKGHLYIPDNFKDDSALT